MSMRKAVFASAVRAAMIASVALIASSCGKHDDSSNGSSGNGGASASATDSAANSADFGDNDMDSNVAQTDTANSTMAGGQTDKSAPTNSHM
jgi:hypothetical protein